MKRPILFLFALTTFFVFGCGETTRSPAGGQPAASEAELMAKYGPVGPADINLDEILENIQWKTNNDYSVLAKEPARKGGTLTVGTTSYPATLRTVGENSSDAFLQRVMGAICYETLMGFDDLTLEYVPGLADKWSISPDNKTFFYHINDKAAWHDGTPVTSYDVVASWDLVTDEAINDPFTNDHWNNYERPVALDQRTIMVKAKEEKWRNFQSFATGLTVYPQNHIGTISAEEYMTTYQTTFLMGSGPYIFEEAKTNQSITFKRNPDWWARNERGNEHIFNFDNIKVNFFTDRNLIIERFKRGDLDAYQVGRAQRWVEEFTPQNYPAIANNHIIKQRVYNNDPAGLFGLLFNIRVRPFDDIRVREAVTRLFNREEMMKELFFNEYEYMHSYYANSPYENKDNPKVWYDPEEAIQLLEEAGYRQDNLSENGYLQKDGEELVLEMTYTGDDTRIETKLKEELEFVGIKLELKQVTWAAHIKRMDTRSFKIAMAAFTGSLFPYPEHMFHSKYADEDNTNNFWGIKNDRVDKLCVEYENEFDVARRIEILKEIDGILTAEYLTAFCWYADYVRLLYWNKFDAPAFVVDRFASQIEYSYIKYWWHNPDKDAALEKAKGTTTKLESAPLEVTYWKDYQQKSK